MKAELFQKYIDSPVGWLKVQASNVSILSISFVEERKENSIIQPDIIEQVVQQLNEYFSGKRKLFDIPLNPKGTEFQKMVWKHVSTIKFGQTASYLDIALKTGSAKNTRAVGMANGKNPIPIIIPCHRIIGSNNKLTGYAGGIERKRSLLQLELKYSENNKLLF